MQQDLTPFARRLVPARPDLAAAHLEGSVAAERFARGVAARVAVPLLDLALSPEPGAGLATQLLLGEPFTLYEMRDDGVSWGQSLWDGYVGYVASDGLENLSTAPGGPRRVTALSSHAYSRADMKSRTVTPLPFLSELHVTGETAGFAETEQGFVPLEHFAPLAPDPVAAARRLLGAPYLWGGRSPAGLDCSALVQLAFMAAGYSGMPRNSDMQEALAGAPLPAGTEPQAGDLVFWKGHVGICSGADRLIHANAHHMAVVEEPLSGASARIEASGGGSVTSVRRPGAGTDTSRPAIT